MPTYFLIYGVYLLSLILGCALTGCLLVNKGWSPAYKLLVLLPAVTLVVEGTSTYLIYNRINGVWIYHVWLPLETATIVYFLTREAVHPAVRRLNTIFWASLPVAIATCFIIHPGFRRANVLIMTFYLFVNLVVSCAVLIDILKDGTDRSIFSRPVSWMAIGILFYSSIFIVVYSVGESLQILGYPIYVPFSYAANTFMYGGCIACFVARSREGRGKSSVSL